MTKTPNKLVLNAKLNRIYDKFEKKMRSGGMACRIEKTDGSFSWFRESGNMAGQRPYPIASVTKLYTTAVMLKLADKNQLSLDDKLSKFLSDELVDGLHIYKGVDYSSHLTLRHILSQTSGLPDYFTEKAKGQKPIAGSFMEDPAFSLAEAVAWTKNLKPHFPPGKRAFYADINFDLLAQVIETASGLPLEENFRKYIFEPLKLTNTYLYKKGMDLDFEGVWYKGSMVKPLNILASEPASGGMISTTGENLIFLKAFWTGRLFDASHFEEMKSYHYLQFFPLQYGLGHMRFAQPGLPELLGHSGSTGVLCYYVPKYDVYVTGVINECNADSKAIMIAGQLAACFKA